eukprot:2716318-Amphidinium_carterae.1
MSVWCVKGAAYPAQNARFAHSVLHLGRRTVAGDAGGTGAVDPHAAQVWTPCREKTTALLFLLLV